MITVFIFHGFLLIVSSILLIRYSDIRSLSLLFFISLFLEFLLSLLLTSFVSSTSTVYFINLGTFFIDLSFFNAPIVFIFDELSGYFFSILFVALSVCLVFLFQYFEYDFFGSTIVILSFLFSQLAFLFFCSFDLISIIFFWEWISAVSFLLIQHWVFRVATIKASIKVFFISQLGDMFFLLGLFFMISFFESTDLSVILSSSYLNNFLYLKIFSFSVSINSLLALSLTVALFLKSAQFFFFPWLLDAMEAPVPISAQLHSSTLVVIGFYLVFRFFDILFYQQWLLTLFFIFGFCTVIGASVLGFFQDDGKKLLACSTASQLGYVIVSLGLGFYEESLMLLCFCCCNKAFTFVWFGVLMNNNSGISDFRLLNCLAWTWFEKAGCVVSTLSSTIGIGSFGWHVKSLFSMGLLNNESIIFLIAMELLGFTWFFSSLYSFKLIYAILSVPTRSSFKINTNLLNKRVFGYFFISNSDGFFFLWFITFLALFLLLCLSNSWCLSFTPSF